MKKNLEELKIDFENALKCNNLEEFKNIKQKISSILVSYLKIYCFFKNIF